MKEKATTTKTIEVDNTDLEVLMTQKFKNFNMAISHVISFFNEIAEATKVIHAHELIQMLEGLKSLEKYTVPTLKGIFTREEFIAIVASQNGTMLTKEHQANRRMFLAHIEDAIEFEAMYFAEVDTKNLLAKCQDLSPAQVYFLQNEIDFFWNETDGKDLEGFINNFITHS